MWPDISTCSTYGADIGHLLVPVILPPAPTVAGTLRVPRLACPRHTECACYFEASAQYTTVRLGRVSRTTTIENSTPPMIDQTIGNCAPPTSIMKISGRPVC